MRDERWDEVCEMIQSKLTLHSRTTEPAEDGNGATEILVFDGPKGKMKLSRTVRGRFIGEKALGTKRIGGDVQVERQYSDSDMVDFLQVFQEDPETGEWKEMQLSDLGLSDT